LIGTADVLLYDHLASAPIVALAPKGCERIYVGKEPEKHALSQAEINALLVERAHAHDRVVRLKGGDPFVFGRGGEEAQELVAAGVSYEVIPGVSSAVAAPAYAGIPLTHREHTASFTVITGHEDPSKSSPALNWSHLGSSGGTLVVMMGLANLDSIARELRDGGLADETPAAVIRDGTLPSQQTVTGTIATIAQDARDAGLSPPAVIVIGDVVKLREEIRWFERLPLFGKRVMITRPAANASRFASELWERGAEPIVAPTIEIGPPDDPQAARDAALAVAENDWIVFTSQNGVQAFFEQLAATGRDARALGSIKVAAIGPQTAAALADHGVRCDLMPRRFISEEIAEELLLATRPHDHILLYRAQETRDVLAAMLERAERHVRNVAAYKTSVRTDPDLPAKLRRADIVTFTSASTVLGFVQNLGKQTGAATSGKVVACIGPITAQAARDAGLRVDVEAQAYTVAGLLTALEGALQSTDSPSLR